MIKIIKYSSGGYPEFVTSKNALKNSKIHFIVNSRYSYKKTQSVLEFISEL